MSFFYSDQYPSCFKMLFTDKMKRKTVTQEFKATVFVDDPQIPLLDENEEQIKFHGFVDNGKGKKTDEKARLYVDYSIPRVKSGPNSVVTNPNKQRPTRRRPWAVKFNMTVIELPNSTVDCNMVRDYLVRGGMLIGIGTHRPMFGRFFVDKFEAEEIQSL